MIYIDLMIQKFLIHHCAFPKIWLSRPRFAWAIHRPRGSGGIIQREQARLLADLQWSGYHWLQPPSYHEKMVNFVGKSMKILINWSLNWQIVWGLLYVTILNVWRDRFLDMIRARSSTGMRYVYIIFLHKHRLYLTGSTHIIVSVYVYIYI